MTLDIQNTCDEEGLEACLTKINQIFVFAFDIFLSVTIIDLNITLYIILKFGYFQPNYSYLGCICSNFITCSAKCFELIFSIYKIWLKEFIPVASVGANLVLVPYSE